MIKVGVYGATGYTGYELVKILLGHPEVELAFLTSETYKGKKLSEVYPCRIEKYLVGAAEAELSGVDAVFTCLPHTTAMQQVARIYRPGLKVIDLSADFRFNSPEEYRKWYNVEHTAPYLLAGAAYGLPELFREKIEKSEIIGNPGCYPTGVLLALAPLVSNGLLQEALAIVDAKSGVTGAGRKPDLTTHFAEVNEDLIPYKVGRVHRHVGEMEIVLTALAGENFRVLFTPQLAPFSRGILSTIYVRTAASAQEVVALYEKTYRREPFVHILEPGRPAQLAFVRHNNSCVLGVHQVPETSYILVTVAIDNLTKGAAGQAVQNFNILFGLDETAGLTGAGGNRR